jgi:hypothetical protein
MACNTRFLKIVFNSAEIFNFITFPRMLSQRLNHFRVCSASDEICSSHAQQAIKFVLRMLSQHMRKFVRRMSVCDKIISAYAQCAIKLFPHMLSVR